MSQVLRRNERVNPSIRLTPLPVSVGVVLGVLVTASTALQAALAVRIPSPWIIPDEIIYSELAKALAGGRLPAIRGEVSFAYGLGYPVLLAPLWALFDDVATAFALAKVLNALVLSLTAVPSYFLARRFVTEPHALVVAALSVAVPSMLYAGTLMTEIALYPVFVLALLAMTLALEKPTASTQAAALAAIALASAVKILSVVLVIAYIAAIFLHGWLFGRSAQRWRARMRAYAPTWLVLAGGFCLLMLGSLLSGVAPGAALGAYRVALTNVDPLSAPWWSLLHLAELDLYLAVVPFALTTVIVVRGLRRGAPEPERLFSALCLSVSAALILVVGAFTSTPSPGGSGYPEDVSRIHERSTFVLAPLFLIGFLMWLSDRRGRHSILVAVAAGAALLPSAIPFEDFDENVRFQALALVPWVETRSDLTRPIAVVAAFTVVLFLVFVLRVRASAGWFVVPIVLVYAAVGATAYTSMRGASQWTRDSAVGSSPDWVDRAVGDASVSVLWAESSGESFVELAPRHRVVFVGEFFNRSLGPVYEIGSKMPYDLPATRVRLTNGRIFMPSGRIAELGEFVLVPCYVRVTGTPIALDPATGAGVYRLGQVVHVKALRDKSCSHRTTS